MARGRRGIRIGVAGLGATVLACLAVVAGTTSAGTPTSTVPAGFDLFETDPAQTHYIFQGPTEIPADFFAPGSDPFDGDVKFAGVPLETFSGKNSGDADTIVQRPLPATPPQTVPIEIVQLSLVSVEPIRVTFSAQNPQLWDVRATLAPVQQQQGQIAIAPGTGGGTFDSQLPVSPRLTFTRLSDGAHPTGGPIEVQVVFQADDAHWRAGCVLPALRLAGLNDGFCPGLTTDTPPQKQVTLETATFASHGVYPAQPALEHFKCYRVEQKPFEQRQVILHDQFILRPQDVTRRAELCNPVQKRDEPFKNRRAHLQCYATNSLPVDQEVAVRNQFGSQRLLVKGPRRLCLPTRKRLLDENFKDIKVPIDHYHCYDVEPNSPLQALNPVGRVKLTDEFGVEKVRVRKPYQLCAPTDKDDVRAQHLVKHLVCYEIKDDPVRKRVQIKNQFEKTKLRTVEPVGLCVPSDKTVVP